MLFNQTKLIGLTIKGIDGEFGTVDQVYFDDESWTIRYLTVETGNWLGGRRVLISPISVVRVDWQDRQLDLSLTMKQVEESPSVDTQLPVSRQHEAAFLGYYGYPHYWGGPYLWGPAYYPEGMIGPAVTSGDATAERIRLESLDSHLRTTDAVNGYNIEAADGEIGHVNGFVIDDKAWAIRYIEVATRNWWPGKKVLISPSWVRLVSWADSEVYVALTREAIQEGPEYDNSVPVTREYEHKLYAHYGRPPYWLNDADRQPAFSLAGV